MGKCGSNPEEHCCWLPNNQRCPYLRTTSQLVRREEGVYWKCKLREELGSWEAVHVSAPYLKDVRPHFEEAGEAHCGDYPAKPGHVCRICGKKAP